MTLTTDRVVLEGNFVRLEPLTPEHAPRLFDAGRPPEIWTHLPFGRMSSLADAERFIGIALERRKAGDQYAFAIEHPETGLLAGSTRYMEIREAHSGLEIGTTWLSPRFQRTAVNTECKLLLLRCAFESLGMERVQLKTDALNAQSRQAIERLGARFEGALRSHMRRRDGTMRDTIMYSIVRSEWPAVEERLRRALQG